MQKAEKKSSAEQGNQAKMVKTIACVSIRKPMSHEKRPQASSILLVPSTNQIFANKAGNSLVKVPKENQFEIEVSTPPKDPKKELQKFKFDKILGPESTAQNIREEVCLPALRDIFLSEKDTLILIMGQPGLSSLFCFPNRGPPVGIAAQILDVLFNSKTEEIAKNLEDVEVSFKACQVHQQTITDLQKPSDSSTAGLKVIESRRTHCQVEGLKSSPITTFDEGIALIRTAYEFRSQRRTPENRWGGCTHMIFDLKISYKIGEKSKKNQLNQFFRSNKDPEDGRAPPKVVSCPFEP